MLHCRLYESPVHRTIFTMFYLHCNNSYRRRPTSVLKCQSIPGWVLYTFVDITLRIARLLSRHQTMPVMAPCGIARPAFPHIQLTGDCVRRCRKVTLSSIIIQNIVWAMAIFELYLNLTGYCTL